MNCDITREIGANTKMDRHETRSRGRRRKIRISDVTCPICFSIMIEPVTMPCRHEMCMPCFEKNGSTASLSCPMCRLRIGAWSRKAAREKKLINIDLWKEIQNHFPKEIAKRLAGEDEDLTRTRPAASFEWPERDDDCWIPFQRILCNIPAPTTLTGRQCTVGSCSVCISEPGEIRKEYEQTLKEFQQEEASLKKEQEKASLELIKKIKEQESKTPVSKTQAVDTSLFPNLKKYSPEDALNKPSDLSSSHSSVSSTLDAPSGTAKSRSSSAQSDDSISPELHYFKPIKAAPRTPPKQNADGKLIEPSLVCIKPRKLSYSVEPVQCDVMQGRLYSVKRDRNLRTEPVLSPTSNLESTSNNCTGSAVAYPACTSLSVEDNDPEVTVSDSGSLGYSLQSQKNTHLDKANKENELSLNCKNNGKRALACEHCSVCSSNGFTFKRLRFTRVQHCTSNSKLGETSKKQCHKCKASELKPPSVVVNSPHRLGKFVTQETCSTWRLRGHAETSSSFTNCDSNKHTSSTRTMRFSPVGREIRCRKSFADSKYENSPMDVIEKSYFEDISVKKKQIEQDYVLARRLQDLFNEEAKQPRKAVVKSEYNLRKKATSISGEEQNGNEL